MGQQRNGADPARLGRVVQARLASQLRAVFDRTAAEPLPNEHVDLLLALRRKERERRSQAAGAVCAE
jgi:hypothetical protein